MQLLPADQIQGAIPTLILDAFEDEIASVRAAAVQALPHLSAAMGSDWVSSTAIPKLVGLFEKPTKTSAVSPTQHSSYLHRITVTEF